MGLSGPRAHPGTLMDALGARLQNGSLVASAEAWAAFRAHALEAYPEECLGAVDASGAYIRMANCADDPRRFATPDKFVLADMMMRDDLRAVCHSHPDGPDAPSEADMRAQYETCVPFAICATNGQATTAPFCWGDELLDDRPLLGRSFRHGTEDCYDLIRSWYQAERVVTLPNYPRNWAWWETETPGEKDLYQRYFADAGFVEAERSAPLEGDVWLAAIRSPVPNHAGLYLDGGLALHHPSSGLPHDPSRLSKRESIARWSPWITHWLRRT
jgi:proteasome lid subunit RPN8/RPN11